MKKMLFTLLLIFLFMGCEKEEIEQCWVCTTTESTWFYEYTLSGEYTGKFEVWQVTDSKKYTSKDGWTQNKIEREVEMNIDNKKIKCRKTPCEWL